MRTAARCAGIALLPARRAAALAGLGCADPGPSGCDRCRAGPVAGGGEGGRRDDGRLRSQGHASSAIRTGGAPYELDHRSAQKGRGEMGRGRNPYLRSDSHAHLPPCPPARHLCHCKIAQSGWRRALCRADRTLSCMGRSGRDGRANRCGRRRGRRADQASIGADATVDASRTRGGGRTQVERCAGVAAVRDQ